MKIFTLAASTCKPLFLGLLILSLLVLQNKGVFAQTTQVYTSNGNWTCPAGVTSVTVQCWGGGGAGGSARSYKTTIFGVTVYGYAYGGGGGGGAYSEANITVTPGTTYSVVVGAGASPLSATSANNNKVSSGGDSYFGSASTVLAKGGTGGQTKYINSTTTGAGNGGTGGLASAGNGNIKHSGGTGENGTSLIVTGYGGGGASSAGILSDGSVIGGSLGGLAVYGGGAGGNGSFLASGNGVAGGFPGGGGGGAASIGETTAYLGGKGAAGQVILTWASCPAVPAITPSSATICSGDIQSLEVASTYNASSIAGATGGTLTASNTTYPNPLNSYYYGSYTQCLVTSAQLSAMGFVAGSKISSMSLYVTSLGNNIALSNFTIEMGATTLTNLSAGFYSNMNTVYSNSSYSVIAGDNTWNLSSPFYWDGTSNVVVALLFSGNSESWPNGGAVTRYANGTANSVRYYADAFNLAGASITGLKNLAITNDQLGLGTTSTQFPNITFTGSNPSTYWSPTATLYTDALASVSYTGTALSKVYAKPATTTTYTVNAGEASVCQVSNTVTVSISTSPTWTGNISDDWNVAGNWCSGTIPTATSDVIIPVVSTNYPVIKSADALANSVTIASGASLTMQNAWNLTISSGGYFTNNGTFDVSGSTGIVVFAGTGTISGTTSFKNVTINGAVDFGTASTITGLLQVNTGAYGSGGATHLVNYTSSSALIYNGTTTTGNEWYTGGAGTTACGQGIPQDVTIQSGTITIPNSGGSNRASAGNIVINNGTTFQMTAGTRDLYVLGNWTNNGGTFNANGRKADFNLQSTTPVSQSITGTTTFYDLSFGNANITTNFGSSVITVTNQFNNDAGTMNGGTSKIILSGGAGSVIGSVAKMFYDLEITGSITHTTGGGAIHVANSFNNTGSLTENAGYTFYFDKSGATETFSGTGTTTFGKLTIGDGSGFSFATTLNCSADFTITGGALTFYKNSVYTGVNNTAIFSSVAATISGSGSAGFYNLTTQVALDPGNNISTVSNNLHIDDPLGSVSINAPLYSGSTSTLIYNTTTTSLASGLEWNGNSGTPGSGQPYNVTIQNTNSVVMAGDRTVPGTLTILNAANTLGLNDHSLTAKDITGSGSLTGSQLSGLVLGGTASALKFTTGSYTNYLKTFTISSTGNATLSNALNIAAGNSIDGYGSVKTDGTLTSNGNLTLKSDAAGTAIVEESAGTIAGDVTIERHIPGLRAWRFLSVPFYSSSQTIRDAWQEGVNNTDLVYANNNNPNDGFGTHITGDNDAAKGFDVNTTQNPSIKTWNTATQDWSVATLPTISTNIAAYDAYCIFVRGSRKVNLSLGVNSPTYPTVLRIKGQLFERGISLNTITKNLSGSVNDWVLTGNPFAAPVSILDIINNSGSAGITPGQFAVWDPKLAGLHNVGAYVTYSGGVWAPAGGSYSSTSPAVIQNGQAFMVSINGASPKLEFKQTNKYTGTQLNVFGAQANTLPLPVIYTNLLAVSGEIRDLSDGVAAAFGSAYSMGKDNYDAAKIWNFGENLALVRDSLTMAIEFRPQPTANDTLFYRLYLRQQPYVLQIFSQNLSGIASKAWIIDKYLGSQMEINLTDTTLYSFTPNTDTNSYRNRFMLVFKNKPAKRDMLDMLIKRLKTRIYPNPVTGKTFNLEIQGGVKGDYTVNIFTTGGKLAVTRKLSYEQGQNNYTIKVPATITAGKYIVQVLNNEGVAVSSMPLIIAW